MVQRSVVAESNMNLTAQTHWWKRKDYAQYDLQPPFPLEFAAVQSTGQRFAHHNRRVVRRSNNKTSEKSYTYGEQEFKSLTHLKRELLDKWESDYPELSGTNSLQNRGAFSLVTSLFCKRLYTRLHR